MLWTIFTPQCSSFERRTLLEPDRCLNLEELIRRLRE